MLDLIDPLEGLGADHIIRVETDHPDLQIQAGDHAYVRQADKADTGALIVANINGYYAVRRHDGELEVHGVIVGIFRRPA